MNHSLADLSGQLTAVVEQAAPYVASLAAHPRHPASAILWQPGVLVTVEHPLRQASSVEVLLPAGRTVQAKIAGRDATTGLAVLRLDAGPPRDPMLHSTTAPKAGVLTVAVGRSRYGNVTASMGIVSAVTPGYRTWHGGLIDPLVQLDYSLYPSANGGAIVDVQGRLLGLATAGLTRYGAAAIPASLVQSVVDQVLAKGFVPRAFLGVGLRPVVLPPALSAQLTPPQSTALLLLSVEPDSSAGEAGLLVGDILCALDGTPVQDPEDVQNKLTAEAIGKALVASILRGGVRADVPLTVGERGQ